MIRLAVYAVLCLMSVRGGLSIIESAQAVVEREHARNAAICAQANEAVPGSCRML